MASTEPPDEELPDAPPPDENVKPSVADDPELTEERNTRDTTWAPYRRFRDDAKFYGAANYPGSFAGDLVGCGFACRQCWSSYGLAQKDKASWYSPIQVAERLIEGAVSNGRRIVRLTHGEPFLYPDHVVALAPLLLDYMPEDDRQPSIWFRIETNGLNATPDVLTRLEEISAKDDLVEVVIGYDKELIEAIIAGRGQVVPGGRLGVRFSLKAIDAETWSWHTGRKPEEYEQLMANLEWAVRNLQEIILSIAVIPQLVRSEEQLQRFLSTVNRWRTGASELIEFEELRVYFHKEREIDRRMGERRLRMAQKTEYWGQPNWDEENMLGNNIAPPWPKA